MADRTSIDGTLTIDGRERTFTLRLPTRAAAGIPLVIVLHVNVSRLDAGPGGAFIRSMTTFDEQADAFGFAVAYPDGSDGSWADGRGVSPADQARVDDVAFLRALISWSARTHGTLPDRAVVAGMSNGACMAHRMGVSASDQVAVIAAVAGGLPQRVRDLPSPGHAVSALLVHGTADPIAPFDGDELALSLAESAAFWRDTDKCVAGDGLGGTRVSTWTVPDGGHTWPGAEPRPGFRKGITKDFDAAVEICRFARPLLMPAADRRLLPARKMAGASGTAASRMAGMATTRADMFTPLDEDLRPVPPTTGADERTTLLAFLRWYRSTLELKCSGLTPEQLARRSAEPSTMSLLGLVRHLADMERAWSRRCMVAGDAPRIFSSPDDPDACFDAAGATPEMVAEAWEAWRAEASNTDRLVMESPSLDIIGKQPNPHLGQVSLRWILVHMVEEYARHLGHADILRERIDGRVGQ